MLNIYLMSLLEAADDAKKKSSSNAKNADAEEDAENTPDTDPEETDTEENQDDNANENQEDEDAGNDAEEKSDESSENEQEQTEDDQENNQDEQDNENQEDGEESTEPGEDDFSLDDPEGGDDNADSSPNPDGLADPDDDGSSDMGMEDDGETNIHTNILQLSKLDRTLAKIQLLNHYRDLRSSINSMKRIIDENEALIDPDVRDLVTEKLDKLFTTVSSYITFKYSITNYEENLQNYLIFTKTMSDLVKQIDEGKQKGKKALKNNDYTILT